MSKEVSEQRSPCASLVTPMVRGHPLIGSLLEIWRDRLGFVASARNHGDVVRFRMGAKTLYLVNDPSHVKYVLADHAENYHKGIGLEDARPLLGEGLLTSEGSTWEGQRKLVEPMLERRRVEAYVPTISAVAEQMLVRWGQASRAGTCIDLGAEMRDLTLEILNRALFAASPGASGPGVGEALTIVLEEATRRMLSPVPHVEWAPTRRSHRLRRALGFLDEVVGRMIRERSGGDSRGDLLSALVSGRAAHPNGAVQLRQEILTLLLAGHETTAVTLTWTLYLLATHPAVEHDLRADLGRTSHGEPPGLLQATRSLLLRTIVKEALRLYPPVWLLPRRAIADDVVGQHLIPAGADVLISPYALHRDSTLWPRPEEFLPARFLGADAVRVPYTYLPFGMGPRRCVGVSFAMAEIQLVLTAVLSQFRLRPVRQGTQMPKPRPLLTLRPPEPFRFRLEELKCSD